MNKVTSLPLPAAEANALPVWVVVEEPGRTVVTVAVTLLTVTVAKSTSMRFTYALVTVVFSRNNDPPVEPATFTIAPAPALPSVLQSFMTPSVKVAMVSSAKSKQDEEAPSTLKSLMDTTVPCPLPCEKAEPTLVNVTWSIVKFPTLELVLGEEPWREPAEIAASVVFLKST